MDSKTKLAKSDAAYFALRKKIADFTLAPGQSISVKILAEELKFSQTPLREALFGLERDGYVIRNKNESFLVARIDRDYIKNLFEYGMMLYEEFLSKCRLKVHNLDNIKQSFFFENGTNTVNPDLFYECAQIGTDNQFVSKQLKIFRCKSASARRALRIADSELYYYIYQYKLDIEDEKFDQGRIIKNIHARKNMHINRITNAIIIYYTNKSYHYDTAVNPYLKGGDNG